MDKIKWPSHESDAARQQREKMRDAIQQDPEIVRFYQEHGYDLKQIDYQIGKLTEFMNSRTICAGCRSLQECPYHPKGYQPVLQEGPTVGQSACARRIEQQKDEEYLNNFIYSDIPNQFRYASFQNYINSVQKEGVMEQEPVCRQEIWHWLHAHEDPRVCYTSKKGLYLYGRSGVGKTMFACMLANDFARQGKKIAFYSVPLLAQTFRANAYGNDDTQTTTQNLMRADVLVLDSMGLEAITTVWRDETLFPALEYRCNKEKITIITSNYDYNGLAEMYKYTIFSRREDPDRANMIVNRLKALTQPIHME